MRAAASDHPGSSGGYSGQFFVYDQMGRLVQQSNPTEITGGWIPAGWNFAGDDSACDGLVLDGFKHYRINHQKCFAMSKRNHINGIENFWVMPRPSSRVTTA